MRRLEFKRRINEAICIGLVPEMPMRLREVVKQYLTELADESERLEKETGKFHEIKRLRAELRAALD